MQQSDTLPMYEDIIDALADLVRQLGGPKKVGPMLRGTSLPVDAAAQWVRDCLNRERRERFDPHQVVELLRAARRAGFHAGKHWLDSELGYEQSKPLDPMDEAADLQRRLEVGLSDLRALVQRLERLTTTPLSVIAGGKGGA
jgi:hypothetical protein